MKIFSKFKDDRRIEKESSNLLLEINKGLFKHLNTKEGNIGIYDTKLKTLSISLIKTENSSLEVHEKKYIVFRDVMDSADNLIAIHSHRTPVSLKAYCLIFIYIFPVVYTPTIINKIGLENPSWLTFFIVILSEFILISLYNIQDQMEYPFDNEGLDDIKFNIFKIDRK